MVRIPIFQDTLAEPTEQFLANLTIPRNDGISVTVDPAVATVNITDDDSELGIREKRERERERERERDSLQILTCTVSMPTAARIGFENTTVSVSEGSGFATLFVAVLGTTRLGGEVTVMFSTSDFTARGNGNLISSCVALSIL